MGVQGGGLTRVGHEEQLAVPLLLVRAVLCQIVPASTFNATSTENIAGKCHGLARNGRVGGGISGNLGPPPNTQNVKKWGFIDPLTCALHYTPGPAMVAPEAERTEGGP